MNEQTPIPGVSPTKVTVIRAGQGDVVALPGFGAQFKLSGLDNGGLMAVVEHPFEVGSITPAHMHSREDEHSFVLAGKIGFRSGDTEVVLGPGGYITKPRGEMHAMWNAGLEPGRIVEIITPGGFENYFRELGQLLAGPQAGRAGSSELRELPEFTALAEKYGLTYGRPDWVDDVIGRYGLNQPSH